MTQAPGVEVICGLAAMEGTATAGPGAPSLLLAPAVGDIVPSLALQDHIDVPASLLIHQDLLGEVGDLVPQDRDLRQDGCGAGREALQRAVTGDQVQGGGPFAVQLGALLLQGCPSGDHLNVMLES